MNPDVWMLRRGAASVLAPAICLAIDLLLLFEPWATGTEQDVLDDSWVHGMIVLPFLSVALVPMSYMLGSLFLRQGTGASLPSRGVPASASPGSPWRCSRPRPSSRVSSATARSGKWPRRWAAALPCF